jgi:glutaredoxin 3
VYIVLGRPNCPFCDKAKELLDEKGKDYRYIDVLSEGNELFLSLLKNNNYRTVPQIFELQAGGYDTLNFNLTVDERNE